MNRANFKNVYALISVGAVTIYALFLFICYQTNILKSLYNVETVEFYYMFTLMGFGGVSYVLDVNNRKQPGFLVLYIMPIHIFYFFSAVLMAIGVSLFYIFVILGACLAMELLGFIIDKYLMEKIINLRNGYPIILLIYDVFFLTVSVIVGFNLLH